MGGEKMTLGKIALLGSTPFFEGMLPGILKDSGYEVDFFKAATIDEKIISRFYNYSLLILSADLVEKLAEEDFFSCVLATRGFLVAESGDRISGSFPGGAEHISHTMSPEEIIFKVNNIVYRSHNVRKSHRVTVNIDVEYECQERWYKSKITTISLFGLFISTLNPLQNNARIRLAFFLPPEGRKIEATGRVLYSIGYNLLKGIISHPESSDKKIIAHPGMGVFFENLSEADRETLRVFIETRSGE
jgi:hypothetical protein